MRAGCRSRHQEDPSLERAPRLRSAPGVRGTDFLPRRLLPSRDVRLLEKRTVSARFAAMTTAGRYCRVRRRRRCGTASSTAPRGLILSRSLPHQVDDLCCDCWRSIGPLHLIALDREEPLLVGADPVRERARLRAQRQHSSACGVGSALRCERSKLSRPALAENRTRGENARDRQRSQAPNARFR